jgi:putative membrane protein
VLSISDLPTLNALLNTISTILLAVGYLMIRQRKRTAHRNCMIAAFVVSVVFLTSYLTYHSQAGSTLFERQGWMRSIYFMVLIPHIVLAAFILPLALITLYFAWRKQFAKHRGIARWTLPVWLYVSVTGIIVYWMLYHLQ